MNMLTRWVPGDILVAVGDGGVLALDGSAQALEAMWTELGEHRCLGDLLKSLSRLHDNEVFTLPDFLMMAIDGQELRVAARGRFCLHLDTADGERSFSASEVVVWEESRYERVNQCILELTPATRHPAGPEGLDEFLPLRSGIVRASQLHIGFGDHQLPLSSPAQTGAHGGQGAPQPSAAQEILQQAQADGAPERDDPPPSSSLPARQEQGKAAYQSRPDPGQTLEPQSMGPMDSAGSPQGTGAGDPAAVLGPDDVPAAEAAAPQAHGQQAQDDKTGRLVERTMMQGAEAVVGPASSQDMDPLAQLAAGPGRHRASPLGESASGRHSSQAAEPLPAQRQAPDGGADAASSNGSAPSGAQGKHDGRTVSAAGLHAARNALGGQTGLDEPSGTGPSVMAVFCEAGHPNPVHASSCRECDSTITSRTGQVERPVLGVLRVSSGATAILDTDVIIGRLPQGTSSTAAQRPRLLTVPSPGKAISKTHCAVRVEGWDMRVEDLGSTNGTFLLRAGEEPRRVPEHQQLLLRAGDIIDIGDGTTLTVEREA
ncbi:FHA domain-containing protein [Actinomyces oris]|uniref:FHA domain-containing protein n=1 Tax=Actinomyces oris TaxID=544580 RepID=A0A508BSA5_9ACTO|nr:FHA domain-containing protein [Actinomyces oris]QQC40305.1 FHA domain-containing protein [Actinomyces oris]TQD62488.1 FHA domain-containing protein [Actinomyces oris]